MQTAERNTSERILASAADLFAAKGYEGTSIREICKRSGVRRPSLYYFYGSKAGLFATVVQRSREHFRTCALAGLKGQHGFIYKCRSLVRLVLQDAADNPLWWRFLLASIWSPSAVTRRKLIGVRRELLDPLERECAKGIERGEIRAGDALTAAEVVAGTVAFLLATKIGANPERLSPSLADAIVADLCAGWSPAHQLHSPPTDAVG